MTEAQKREILERVFEAWIRRPHMRLGQLVVASRTEERVGLFEIGDEDLAASLEDFAKIDGGET